MFTNYFNNKSKSISLSLEKNLADRGIQLPGKEKDLNLFKEYYTFLREHLPAHFSLATGKVRSKKHILNRNCDVLVYNKWCQKLLEMTGGYVIVDSLSANIGIETDLTTGGIVAHAALTKALKSLYQSSRETEEDKVIPIFSILFAYKSAVPLLSHKIAIKDASKERDISLFHEIDMICVLNDGLIIKDWENNGDYKIVETGKDTLLWFYILLIEYLEQDSNQEGINLRDYIKNSKEYKEY